MTQLHKWFISIGCILVAGVGLLGLSALDYMTRIAQNPDLEPVIADTLPTSYLQDCLMRFGWAAIGLLSLTLGPKARNLWFLMAAIIAVDAFLVIRLYRIDGFFLAAASLCFFVAAMKGFVRDDDQLP